MELEEAMAIVEAADPEAKMRISMHRAVADTNFVAEARRQPPGPSMAGLDPRNAHIISAQERAHEAMLERERLQAAQREPSRAELAEALAAGQAPSAVAAIKASLR